MTKDLKIVKIADFGVARFKEYDSPITRVGTNIYAPPEHSPMLAGETGNLKFTELTPAADVYSLAKSAYVLITNESPRFFSNQPINELPHAYRKENWAESLVKILNRATLNDPRDRYQTINDFWKELSNLKLLTDTNENHFKTRANMRFDTSPQAQIAIGYSPNVPVTAKFNTSKELKIKHDQTRKFPLVVELEKSRKQIRQNPVKNGIQTPIPDTIEAQLEPANANPLQKPAKPKKKRKFLRITATFIILIGIFAGSLFATYNYLTGRGFFRGFGTTENVTMGTAKTNINLRPQPTTKNEPIGLITVNSRLRVLEKQNNWYRIEIQEYGEPKRNPDFADSGWAYGKYITIDE